MSKHYPAPERHTDHYVFAVGNGHTLLYLDGPCISQCIGSPYSSPTAFSLTLADSSSWDSEVKDNIATHRGACGVITDFASSRRAFAARQWKLECPVFWHLDSRGFEMRDMGQAFAPFTSFLIKIPSGASIMGRYTTRDDRYMLLLFDGDAKIAPAERGLSVATWGRGTLRIVPGSDLPECLENSKAAMGRDFEAELAETRQDNACYTVRRRGRMAELKQHPLRETALSCSDDIAWLIRSQQGAEGGIQAGTNYHLAYIRDEYGASRGLLAAGCHEEAAKILSFYLNTFSKSGMLANAQGIGEDGIFHIHEHDESEITGYLLHQAMDLFAATKDEDFLRSLFPMLDWAVEKQLSVLHNDMLPFNGDETYVAGHIVPRTVLDEGSLEATSMFITGARRYLSFRNPKSEVLTTCDRVEQKLKDNFCVDGQWYSNSPARIRNLNYIPYRNGVCMATVSGKCRGNALSWCNIHAGGGLYLCTGCMANRPEVEVPKHDELIKAKSVTLSDLYLGMRLLPENVIRRDVDSFLAEFRRQGYLSTRSGEDRCLGLDYGLHLYAARELGIEAEDLLRATLAARDDTGAWTEYYEKGTPICTPCRPWESGVNIDAIIHYLKV